jgi:hypothetical protein
MVQVVEHQLGKCEALVLPKKIHRFDLVWLYTPVIPATQEVEIGGLRSETCVSQSMRPYLKTKLKQKKLGTQLK